MTEAGDGGKGGTFRWMLGLGGLSASALGLEMALTNVFGVLLQYHYVSLVVSLAVFGIGAGSYAARRQAASGGRAGGGPGRRRRPGFPGIPGCLRQPLRGCRGAGTRFVYRPAQSLSGKVPLC
ncbi:hypothetical protein [Cohnella rhizosphaerae]|uniref:Uncharacterized protein n=1 Tax=Cohnella rhizosphaerae TaxID=1457232 RepID=A0A9X4KPS4_9BACL|nr:hypothetical protein [Cohnella rhizosphaerae]MDG0808941.1 hypothetical protein [Cohnella rhizosphaerae]